MGADVIAMAIDCPDDGPKKLPTISISGVDMESSETRGRKPTSGCKAAKIDADVFPQWKTSGTASDDCQKKAARSTYTEADSDLTYSDLTKSLLPSIETRRKETSSTDARQRI